MQQYSADSLIQGPPAFYYWETESWEDLSRRVVEEISISVPYANNGRVLRPLLGRLRPSSPGRIQGTEDHTVSERVPSGIQHAHKKKRISGDQEQEPTGDYLEQLYSGRVLSQSQRRWKVGQPPC